MEQYNEQFGEHTSQFMALTVVIEGMPLIYSGQEAGLDRRLAFFEKDEIEWVEDHEFSHLYKELLMLKKQNKALWNGKWGGRLYPIETNDSDKVFAFFRQKDNNSVIALFNISDDIVNVSLNSWLPEGNYQEYFDEGEYELKKGVELTVNAKGYRIFTH